MLLGDETQYLYDGQMPMMEQEFIRGWYFKAEPCEPVWMCEG